MTAEILSPKRKRGSSTVPINPRSRFGLRLLQNFGTDGVLWGTRDSELDWSTIDVLVRFWDNQEEVVFAQEVMASEAGQFELTRFTIWL